MRIQNLREFSLLSAAGTVSLMPLLVLPAMIGVLVDESALSERFAGLSASVNFAGGALVSMLMALRMHRIDLRRAAAAALLLAAGMDAVSAFSTGSETLFLLARFAAGVGTGAAYTCISAAFARYADLDRGYGLFVTLQFIVSGIGLYLLPVHASRLGTEGMFLSIAALEVLALALVWYLPGRAVLASPERVGRSERAVLLAPATLFAVASFGLFEAANTAQFTYSSASASRSHCPRTRSAPPCWSLRSRASRAPSSPCCSASASVGSARWRSASRCPRSGCWC
jgi:MFS family permease